MTEEEAKRASDLLNKIKLAKNLMLNECRPDIPDYYIKSIKQLASIDDEFKFGFYKLMQALGSKSVDKYRDRLNNL